MLFTDIEGSTKLLQKVGANAYVRALEDHRRLLREAMRRHGGIEVEMQGDSFFFAFAEPAAAVAAACEAQSWLAHHGWDGDPVLVRMGLHTGEPLLVGDRYAGLDVHRAARIMDAGHGGQILLSERTADLVAGGLPLGIALSNLGEHRLKDLRESERLVQLLVTGLEHDFPPPRGLGSSAINLPSQPTPLVGRERELAEVVGLLGREEIRLLTLTGPGGTGKTRLALRAAEELAAEMEGVYFVNLAPLTDSNLVIPTIARTLGLDERPGEGLLATLSDRIAGKKVLLLLDNFEQVADAGPAVSELRAGNAALKLLVTSRASVHLYGEHEYAVPPLAGDEAVDLFAERARAVTSMFTLDHRQVVREICRQLDDLPLAIELAAARIKLLPERTLLERLDQRFKLLTGGARDRHERQRTLRATIDWSYDLLSAREKRLFRRLSVFAGGRTLETIEQVCDPEGKLDVLDSVASLVDKSLLRRQETGDARPRFVMLKTIQAYATDRLEESDECETFRRRHADCFLELAEQADEELRGPEQATWNELLELEHNNFRSAMEWSMRKGDGRLALEIAGRLWRFWLVRGHLSEGRRWLEAALGSAPAEAASGRALRGLATLAIEQGALDRGVEAAGAALALDREIGDERGAVHSLGLIADVVAFRGDLAAAKELYEEAAVVARRCGARLQLATNLYCLGQVARLCGDPNTAEARYTDALAVYAELEDSIGQGGVGLALAEVAGDRGDHGRAFSLLASSVEAHMKVRYVSGLLDGLDAYATLFAEVGQPESAARLWGAREMLGKEIGRGFDQPHEAASRKAAIASVRETLGDEAFRRAWAAGASMPLEAAVAATIKDSPENTRRTEASPSTGRSSRR